MAFELGYLVREIVFFSLHSLEAESGELSGSRLILSCAMSWDGSVELSDGLRQLGDLGVI